MAFHTIDRDGETDVVFDGGGRDGWTDLLRSLPGLVQGHRPLVLDVSALTLLPAEVADLRRVVGTLTGRDVRIACSRLSGRRLLRRLLPDEVAVVLAEGVIESEPTVGPEASIEPEPTSEASFEPTVEPGPSVEPGGRTLAPA